MLEREGEARAVSEVIDGARTGRGGSLFVVGEAGLGKTTLLELARAVAGPGMRVGAAQGDAMETGLPFALMSQLVDGLGGQAALEGGGPFASADDARASRHYRTLRWLRSLAADGPVLLAIDDLHWSDGDSLALVSYLSRRITSLPVAVVSTLRPWPPGAEELSVALAAAGHARVERLSPLSERAARALLVHQVGHALADAVVEKAWASSAGNPVLLESIAPGLAGEPANEGATRPGSAPGDTLLLRRFAGLPAAGLRLARAASVMGSRFHPGLAVALADLDADAALLAMDALSTSGLVLGVAADEARFKHLLFRQALYDDLPPMVRRELHGRAFRLLMDRGLETEAAEHAVLGSLSGDAQAVAGCAVRVGRRCGPGA